MKLNKSTQRTKSEQHRQYQSAAVFNKEVCISAIRCFFFSANDLSLLQFGFQSKIFVRTEYGEQGLDFLGEMSNQIVSDGALLSLGLRSANGPGAVAAE